MNKRKIISKNYQLRPQRPPHLKNSTQGSQELNIDQYQSQEASNCQNYDPIEDLLQQFSSPQQIFESAASVQYQNIFEQNLDSLMDQLQKPIYCTSRQKQENSLKNDQQIDNEMIQSYKDCQQEAMQQNQQPQFKQYSFVDIQAINKNYNRMINIGLGKGLRPRKSQLKVHFNQNESFKFFSKDQPSIRVMFAKQHLSQLNVQQIDTEDDERYELL